MHGNLMAMADAIGPAALAVSPLGHFRRILTYN
jgi:hypothetical protein